MAKTEKNKKKEFSIDDKLDQIIDMKKSENSALKKIYNSLKKNIPKSNTK